MSPVFPIPRITTVEELDTLISESGSRPVWLIKHSLICPLSSEGLREFQRFAAGWARSATFAVIEVQNAREVSEAAASRLAVRHETPQALLVLDGEAKWHGSHWTITAEALRRATESLGESVGRAAR